MPIVQFESNVPEAAKLSTAVKQTLIEGHKPSSWFKAQSQQTLDKLMGVVRTGLVNGEGSDVIARRISGGVINGVQVLPAIKATRKRAAAIGRTAVNAVQSKARLETFKENGDVVKGYQQISTLDGRTSDVCVAYSGEAWDLEGNPIPPTVLPFNGGPPRHFNCRSSLVPVLKSFKELGIDLNEIPEGTRASMDGQVPGDITFDAWLKGKGVDFQNEMLGTTRAALWREGKITLKQLVDMSGDPLSIEQLEELVGDKPLGWRPADTSDRIPPFKWRTKEEVIKLQQELFYEQKDMLTEAEQRAVKAYQRNSGFGDMQDALRRGETPKGVSAQRVIEIDAAIEKTSIQDVGPVFRNATQLGDIKLPTTLEEALKIVGSESLEPGYLSTSLSYPGFAGTTMRIHGAKKGLLSYAARPTKHLMKDIDKRVLPEGAEVILPRNKKYRIIGASMEDNPRAGLVNISTGVEQPAKRLVYEVEIVDDVRSLKAPVKLPVAFADEGVEFAENQVQQWGTKGTFSSLREARDYDVERRNELIDIVTDGEVTKSGPQKLRLQDLQTFQSTVNKADVERLAAAFDDAKFAENGLPVVYKLPDGTLLLKDGNHRVNAALLAGRRRMDFEVWEIE